MKKTYTQIQKILQSEELVNFIIKKLEAYPKNSIIKKPRVLFKKNDSEYEKKSVEPQETNYIIQENFEFYKQDAVIAGGSIAAWINEYLYQIPAKINDIDIFYYKFDSKSKDELESEFYEGMIEEDRFQYEVQKVSEEGVYNLIRFMPTPEFSWEFLLESFDLNCCQIGLNLQHKSLFFSKDFINFLENKIIDYNPDYSFESPLMSFIRGQLKAQELNAKFYLGEHLIDFYINKVPHVLDLDEDEPKSINYIPFSLKTQKMDVCEDDELFISEKRLQLLNKNPHILEPWLVYNSESQTLSFGKIYQEYHWSNFIISIINNSDNDSFYNGLLHSEYNYKRNSSILKEKIRTLNNIEYFLESKFIPTRRVSESIAKLCDEKMFLFREPFAINDLKNLSNTFLTSHSEFPKYTYLLMNSFNYSINDLINFYKEIKGLNPALIGYTANFFQELFNNPNDVRFANIVNHLKNKSWKAFFQIMEKDHKSLLDKDFLCLPLKITPFDKIVKELTANSELIYEGKRMSHCVGGYGTKIKNGESRIFAITIKGVSSTLEVLITKHKRTQKPIPKKYQNDKNLMIKKAKDELFYITYSLGQNKAKYNYQPSNTHKKIADLLIKYLNKYNLTNDLID